jgi:YVTN family beta-propeller protein
MVSTLLDSKENDFQPNEPFIGPRPFRAVEADQLRFSGRDSEIDEIVALITSQRVVLIYAQSGAGKTSIINAGVIPSLMKDGFEVLPVARVQITSPTSDIVSESQKEKNEKTSQMQNIYVYNALQSLGREKPEINPEAIIDLELFEFLDKYFPTHKNDQQQLQPQLLIFDQLEEIFSFYPDNWVEQQKGFFRQIADALYNNPMLRVIFVIREDFLAQLDPFRSILPEKLRTRFRLERLRRNQATLAIKKPLKKLIENLSSDEKANIESEINALVNDLLKMNIEDPPGTTRQLEGEFIEPIQLQVVCRRWWNERSEASKSQRDSKASLRDLGNVDRALEDFYDDAILSASKETKVSEGKIRIWCQKKLITSSGTRSITHRGQRTTEGLDNKVIDWLERKYLIRKEWRSGASWYELTHDRLIKPMLNSNARWREQDRGKKNKRLVLTGGIAAAAAITIIIIAIWPSLNQPTIPSFTVTNVNLGNSPTKVAVNEQTGSVYAANAVSRSMFSLPEQRNGQTGLADTGQPVIPLEEGAEILAVNPNTHSVYVASSDSETISVINGVQKAVVKTIPMQGVPMDMAVNPKTNTIYVASSDSETVSVIEGTRNAVIKTIPVENSPDEIAVNPNTNTVYVASITSNIISVIDGTTNRVEATIPPIEDKGVDDLAINENTNTVYAASSYYDEYGYSIGNGTISVIDGTTNRVEATILPGSDLQYELAVNPKTNTIYVASSDSDEDGYIGNGTISVIDGTRMRLIGNLGLDRGPEDIAFNPNTNTVYATNSESEKAYTIDGTAIERSGTNSGIIETIDLEDMPNDVAIDPITNVVHIAASSGANAVYTIDGTAIERSGTNSGIIETIDLEYSSPDRLAVNPNTNTVYVASSVEYDYLTGDGSLTGNGTISVIDGTTNELEATIPIEGGLFDDLAVNPNTNTVYVASSTSNITSVIDGTTNRVEATIPIEGQPDDLAINENTNTVYVGSSDHDEYGYSIGNGTISVIDGTTNELEATIPIEGQLDDLAINENTNTVYVASVNTDTVYAIKGTATNSAITGTIDLDSPSEIAVNPKTNTVYVGSLDSETFYIIDGATNVEIRHLRVEGEIDGIFVNPNSTVIYFTTYVYTNDENTLYVVDSSSNTVVGTEALQGYYPVDLEGHFPTIEVNPNTARAYVAVSDPNTVYAINGTAMNGTGTNNIPREEIFVGGGPIDLAVNVKTNTVYTADSHKVYAIDNRTNYITGIVPVSEPPTGIAVNPNTTTVYVAVSDPNTVYAINGTAMNGTATNSSIRASIPLDSSPTGIAVNPSTNKVYVAGYSTNNNSSSYINGTVYVIDGATNKLERIPIQGEPIDLAVNAKTNTIYVASSDPNKIFVIDGTGKTQTIEVPLDSSPTGIAVNPNMNIVFVSSYDAETIYVIDSITNTILSKIPVQGSPIDLAVNAKTNTVYSANADTSTLSIIQQTFKE